MKSWLIYFLQDRPLHEAARLGRVNVVGTLIEHGADIYAVDGRGKTAMTVALDRKQKCVDEYMDYICNLPRILFSVYPTTPSGLVP